MTLCNSLVVLLLLLLSLGSHIPAVEKFYRLCTFLSLCLLVIECCCFYATMEHFTFAPHRGLLLFYKRVLNWFKQNTKIAPQYSWWCYKHPYNCPYKNFSPLLFLKHYNMDQKSSLIPLSRRYLDDCWFLKSTHSKCLLLSLFPLHHKSFISSLS